MKYLVFFCFLILVNTRAIASKDTETIKIERAFINDRGEIIIKEDSTDF